MHDYDASGRLTSIEATNAAGETVTEASYSYDNGGSDSDQLQSKTVDGQEENYSYDALNRLTSNGERDYSYDDAGNLTQAGQDEFTYNDADQATRARGDELDHDKAGNLVEKAGAQLQYSPTNQWTKTDQADGDLQTSLSYDTSDSTQLRGITDIKGDTRIDRQVVNTALGISGLRRRAHPLRPRPRRPTDLDDRHRRRHPLPLHHRPPEHRAVSHQGRLRGRCADGGLRLHPLRPDHHRHHRFFSPGINQFTQPDPSRQESNN